MEKNQTSYKLSGLLGLLCLAVLQMSQLCASKRTSLKSQSNYTQAGRTKRPDKHHIIDENFNVSNNDPLDKDLTNRDDVGNPLDFEGNSIKVGTRKAFASGSSKRNQPFTLDNQKFYLERRAEQAKDRQSEKESRENRLTDLGIKLEDLLDRKDIGRDSRSKLEAFQAKIDNLYNLLKANHISTAPESILEQSEEELDSIEKSLNNKSISSTFVARKPTLSSVTLRNPLYDNHDLTIKRRDDAGNVGTKPVDMAKLDRDIEEFERVMNVKLDPRMRIILANPEENRSPSPLVAKRSENVGTKPVDMAKMDRDFQEYERVFKVKLDPRMRIILANPEENR